VFDKNNYYSLKKFHSGVYSLRMQVSSKIDRRPRAAKGGPRAADNLVYTEQCLYRQDNRYSSFFSKEWFYLYQIFRQMFS